MAGPFHVLPRRLEGVLQCVDFFCRPRPPQHGTAVFESVLPSLRHVVVVTAYELGDEGPFGTIAGVQGYEFVVLFVGPMVRFLRGGLKVSSHETVDGSPVSSRDGFVDGAPEILLGDDARVAGEVHFVSFGMLDHPVEGFSRESVVVAELEFEVFQQLDLF